MSGEQPSAVWLVGGLDPSGGAGVLRDFATARAVATSLPTHTAVTSFTVQGDGLPARGEPVSPQAFARQFERAPRPGAVKVGLVPAVLVEALVEVLSRAAVPVVVDPVLSATAGGTLGASVTGLEPLLRLATVLTPNLPELAQLTEASAASFRQALGIPALLVKGGHAPRTDDGEVEDVLHLATTVQVFRRPRCGGPSPRGTGCALATAIACGLATGKPVVEACSHAIAWLDRARVDATLVGPQVLL